MLIPPTYTTEVVQRGYVVCSTHQVNRSGNNDPSVAVVISDSEYPVRPAFSLLAKLLDDFTTKVPQNKFQDPGAISFPEIQQYLVKYQDPRQADTIMRVQQELDETKIVLVRGSLFL